jgi:stage II sporulation protein AA (anti-sigma F factor antagonist)
MRQVQSTRLKIDVSRVDGLPCVRLSGEGSREAARQLQYELETLISAGDTHIILDTRELTFLDPGCFEVLAEITRLLAEEGGSLVVADQSSPVERSLKLLGLDRIAPVVLSPTQAAAYFRWEA